MKTTFSFHYLMTLLLLGACSTENPGSLPSDYSDLENVATFPAAVEPMYNIEFIPEVTYGHVDDPVLVAFSNHFVVDDSGRVIIADWNQSLLQAYNSDGTYLTQISRRGSGPGEVMTMNIGIHDGILRVYDANNFRISSFSLDGFELLNIVTLNPDMWSHIDGINSSRPADFHYRDDGLYLISFPTATSTENIIENGSRKSYLLFNHRMESVSDILFEEYNRPPSVIETGGRTLLSSMPFNNLDLLQISENGSFYTAKTEDFIIRIYNSEGVYERAIFHPYRRSAIDRDDFLERYRNYSIQGSGIRNMEFPDTWPALKTFFVDDENRIWVATITDDSENFEWWVLNPSGDLLAKFLWPGQRMQMGSANSKMLVRDNFLYTLDQDRDSLLFRVTRYRIEFSDYQPE